MLTVNHSTWKALQVARAVLAKLPPNANKKETEERGAIGAMDDVQFLYWAIHQGINFIFDSREPFKKHRPLTAGQRKKFVADMCDKCYCEPGILDVAGKKLCEKCVKTKFNPGS